MTILLEQESPRTEQPSSRLHRLTGGRPRLVTALLAAALLAALIVSWSTDERDSRTDLVGLAGSTLSAFVHLRWPFAVVVLALAVLHYLATAIAARTVAGVALPLRETMLVQFAAAAANRLTPAGLGGSALNVRYFTRRGQNASAAVGAVALLSVVAAIADLVVLCLLVLVGGWFGMSGSRRELSMLAHHVSTVLGPVRSPWLWLAVAGGVALVGIAVRLTHRRARLSVAGLWQPALRLARRPREFLILLAASGSTTLILAFAFAASTAMVPGPAPKIGLGALVIAFMLASAVGSAVPTPAGLGSSEAAFVAVLLSAQVPAAQALEEVLIYRLLTFWTPAAFGLFAARHLCRRKVL